VKLKVLTLAMIAAVTYCSCSKKNADTATPAPTTEEVKTTAAVAAASTITFTDESSFVNTLSSYGFKTPDQLSLNRIGSTSGYTSVYGFNIPTANRVTGFKWNSGDEQTNEWRPQGIGGFTYGGKKFLVVSWYAIGPGDIAGVNNQHKGVRLALADITSMSNITYRLILLVQNKANMTNPDLYRASNSYTQLNAFCPVTIHAGGVSVYANKLFVADTRLGIRVFDLTKFVSAAGDAGETRCGMETNGDLKAFNYGYILPQSGYYKITNASPFSCIELGQGATASDRYLWTGQYITASETPVPRVFGFGINTSGQVNTTNQPAIITPVDNDDTHVHGIQGVYRTGIRTFMSTTGNSSYEGSTARLTRYNDGAALGVRYRWPHGAEDLYFDSVTGYLWCLTEYETAKYGQDNRCVFAVRLSDYD
jgi:hypothetical protein